jgi:AcrR family transcriptional regulator
MTRKKTINPELVLDAAEIILIESGVQHFTLEAVAKRAEISKGGLLYIFPTKDQLILAMLDREVSRFSAEVLRNSEVHSEDPHATLLGYIATARSEDVSIANKAANLMAALIHAPAMLEPARLFYFKMLGQFDSQSIEGRRGRLAYLAVEGAFLLRALGLKAMTEEEWLEILADAQDMYLDARALADKPS